MKTMQVATPTTDMKAQRAECLTLASFQRKAFTNQTKGDPFATEGTETCTCVEPGG